MDKHKELSNEQIRFCAMYNDGGTLIITKQGNSYSYKTQRLNVGLFDFNNFMRTALNKRYIAYLGLGNKLYYGKEDKGYIRCLKKISKNDIFPTTSLYKHWQDYIRKDKVQ